MSIATLKRKSFTQYNNMSVNQKNFSLNGTHRSQGYVGQTMLSRSLPRTLQKGYGGTYGFYKNVPVVMSSVFSTENINVVKPSVINEKGLLHDSKHNWVFRPAPITSVKPDDHINLTTQQDHIEIMRKKNLACIPKPTNKTNKIWNCGLLNIQKPGCLGTSKPQNYFTEDQSLYILQKPSICYKNNESNSKHNPQIPIGASFPKSANKNINNSLGSFYGTNDFPVNR